MKLVEAILEIKQISNRLRVKVTSIYHNQYMYQDNNYTIFFSRNKIDGFYHFSMWDRIKEEHEGNKAFKKFLDLKHIPYKEKGTMVYVDPIYFKIE